MSNLREEVARLAELAEVLGDKDAAIALFVLAGTMYADEYSQQKFRRLCLDFAKDEKLRLAAHKN